MTQRAETLRRIQVGILGLGVVVAMLVIGSAIMSRLRVDPARTSVNVLTKPNEKPKEPSAKLGIAPADVQENIAEGVKQSKIQ